MEEDNEERKAEAGQAYATVNAILKPSRGSTAHAVIRESETFQDLPTFESLGKLFTDQYLSYSTV